MIQSPKNILIIGANFSNKGAEAMMKTVKQQLSLHRVDGICYMLCRPYERHLAVENGFTPIYKPRQPAWVRYWKRFKYRASGKVYKILHGESKKWYFSFPFDVIQTIMNDLDMVIDVSGFAYADSWGKPMIDETAKLVDMCKKKGVRFYFLPQAWGSFDIPEVAVAVKNMLTKADGYFARDEKSRRYLSKALGMQESAISLFPDIVFSFTPNELPVRADLSGYKGEEKLLVGISPNLRVYEKTAKVGGENEYMSLLLAICSFCLDKMNANLVLIPNETFPDTTNHPDDRKLCEILYQNIGRPNRCAIVNRYASAEEIKSYVGEIDVLISSRFHALIFGLTQRKPVLAISWSHKYRELFALFGLEKFVIEADAIDDHKDVIEKLKQLIQTRHAIAEKIDTVVPRLQSQVDELFGRIFSAVNPEHKINKTINVPHQWNDNHE